jgi:hypothetical protein
MSTPLDAMEAGVQRVLLTPRGPLPTLWHSDGISAAWDLSDDLILFARPRAVQLHTWEPRRLAPVLQRLLPGVQLVVGVGIDGIARDVAKGTRSVAWGVSRFVELARRAVECGAVAIKWNAEAGWKRPPNTTERALLVRLVREGLAAVAAAFPGLVQWHTAYDHPSLHSGYVWEAWLGAGSPVVASFPQVYAAPGDGLMAHRGALPRREARALASWAAAVRAGWIRPDAPEGTPEDLTDVDWRPYYQVHHVPVADTVASAVRHPLCALWALPTRADRDGRRAFVALCALDRLGFWGEGAVQRFQASRRGSEGLTPDGVYGPRTEAALIAAAGIDPRAVA